MINYPLQSLAIIGPILFLVLMIITPVIGVFAGWKRAAYWGGGTFFFFIVGVIIWKAAGQAIVNPLVSLIGNLLKEWKITPTAKLTASLAAPVFFLLVMMLAELILLINYYAWFKRVAKIKQDIKLKKEMKAAKKAGKKMPKVSGSGWTQMQFTTKGKAINMACGGVGLALLMAPSTVTFTQAVMYTTTSATTRANNAFAAGLYNSLQGTAKAFSWMSYYGNGDTAKDFDSVFATLNIANVQVTIKLSDGTTKTVEGVEAIGTISSDGISSLVKTATDVATKYPEDEKAQLIAVGDSVNQFADNWNNLMTAAGSNVSTMFASENVTEMLKPVVKALMPEGQETITKDQIDAAYGEGSLFKDILQQVVAGYAKEGTTIVIEAGGGSKEFTKLQTVMVSKESYYNIKDSFASAIPVDADAKETFDEALGDIISMMFAYPGMEYEKKTI